MLGLFRRLSFRSALTVTLSTRIVPVLLRDSHRLADAQRCRPGHPPSRVALMRAATAGAFDRALDVAAALEVRGYGAARRPQRWQRPWSRHDLAFAASSLAIVALAVAGRVAGLGAFRRYPALRGAGAEWGSVLVRWRCSFARSGRSRIAAGWSGERVPRGGG